MSPTFFVWKRKKEDHLYCNNILNMNFEYTLGVTANTQMRISRISFRMMHRKYGKVDDEILMLFEMYLAAILHGFVASNKASQCCDEVFGAEHL